MCVLICYTFFSQFPEACVEPLIALYDSLQQKDSAVGVLNYAQKYLNISRNESW